MKKQLKFPDQFMAVFNLHVNNAGDRAINICRHRFNADDGDMKFLESAYRDGIMAIFNEDPTEPARLFANACFIFTNGLDT